MNNHKRHFGKKLLAISLIGGSLFTLSACGKQAVDVKVSNGTYVQEIDHSAKSGQGYLALKVNVKNTTNQKLEVSSDNFKLKKGDKSISPESVSIDGMNDIHADKLDKDDTASGYVFFKVDKKDKYQLKYSPESTDYSKNDKLSTTSVEVNTAKYKDPGQSAKKAAKQYVDAVFLNNKDAQNHNDLENNVKQDAKKYHDDFVNGLRDQLDKDAVSDQQADKIFQDYVNDGAKRNQISYKIYEAEPNKVTVEIVAKTVNFDDMDFEKLSDDFKNDFINKHKDDDEIDEDQVTKEASQYVLDKLPEMISKAQVSTDDSTGYHIELTKKDGKWQVETTGSNAYDYNSLRNQFLGGVASSY